jgi:hypothetical protein
MLETLYKPLIKLRCSNCGLYFLSDPSYEDDTCPDCVLILRDYQANKARLADQQRAYYQANKARLADQQRAYREANKARLAGRKTRT